MPHFLCNGSTNRHDGITIKRKSGFTPPPDTFFWRKTHYGFIRDTGHLYYKEIRRDFVALVQISGSYASFHNQAGLMLRAPPENWVKCGIEFVHGVQQASERTRICGPGSELVWAKNMEPRP
jgi:regulation of enolase protein 1 (concanavalin A-like superfamily)